MTLVFALLALQVVTPPVDPLDVSVVIGEAAAKEAVSSLNKCTLRSFQAFATSTVDGKSSQTNIALCAKPGESDQQWLQTLKITSDMVLASSLSANTKTKLTTELRAAIERVRAEMAADKSPARD